MDLRAYYKKVREIENQLPSPFVVVVSLETPEGGRPGVLTEVVRLSAAKQIAEGRARAATDEESERFHLANHEAQLAAENASAMKKMQFIVVPATKTGSKTQKD
jgi:hypothetical protein